VGETGPLTGRQVAELLASVMATELASYAEAEPVRRIISDVEKMGSLEKRAISESLEALHQELLRLGAPLESIMKLRRAVWVSLNL